MSCQMDKKNCVYACTGITVLVCNKHMHKSHAIEVYLVQDTILFSCQMDNCLCKPFIFQTLTISSCRIYQIKEFIAKLWNFENFSDLNKELDLDGFGVCNMKGMKF